MAYQKNDGINNLASVLDARMRGHSDKPLVVDFGQIQQDGSLLTNTFPVPIPKSDYRICRQLSIGSTGDAFARVDTTEGNGWAYLPEKMRKLKPGDRVLIAWVQNVPVVIDIILKP